MDKKDIEKYKQEMMNLYGRSTVPAEESVFAVNTRPETEKLPEVSVEPERDIQTEPQQENSPEDVFENSMEDIPEENVNELETLEERYPEPDLSELETDFGQENEISREPVSEDILGKEIGYIKVNVRTGDDSEPIENASIQITAIVDGNRLHIASGITDKSGTAPRFAVPAPSVSLSQQPDPNIRPYSNYDISVTADGFFNARSVDVPVFMGITSVQSFSMVPVPLFMKSNEETVTNFNQEPNL